MRGNHPGGTHQHPIQPSIPAYAGEPGSGYPVRRAACVYPRVCGGTLLTGHPDSVAARLSPRMRGNPRRGRRRRTSSTSIPAYAGEPSATAVATVLVCVYPRVCGGTPCAICPICGEARLSPRMRGNLYLDGQPYVLDTSIPAYAGEPLARDRAATPANVYPRVCGGTRTWLCCHWGW